jgi:hypothetical protein
MRGVPLDVIATWPRPNYTDPARHDVGFYIVSPLLLVVATLCVGARLYGRIFVRRWFGPDDILITVAWVLSSRSLGAFLTPSGVYRRRVGVLRTWDKALRLG